MTAIVETVSTRIADGIRYVKNKLMGRANESTEVSPYGWDSCPIAGIKAVYVDTANVGSDTIVGYVNKSRVAQEGESRMYSTDSTGADKFFVYVQAAKITIGTGTPINHFTQYEGFDMAVQSMVSQINTNLTAIATGLNAIVPGSYTPVPVVVVTTGAMTTNILTN